MERTVKLTTTAGGQIAGSKRQIGRALCSTILLLEEKAMDRKKILVNLGDFEPQSDFEPYTKTNFIFT